MNKFRKLIVQPKKLLPFLRQKIDTRRRKICELFGSDMYSKPYIGHDIMLEHIKKEKGFFVQCGGYDGYGSDPTYYLEKFMGWSGIIVEPLPVYKICKSNRSQSLVIPCTCVSSDYKKDNVDFTDCGFMSFIKNETYDNNEWIRSAEESQNIKSKQIVVPACTIQSIIDKHSHKRHIDLLVADVEGYELEILKGLDFKVNPPDYILLEARDPEILSSFLEKYKYTLITEAGKNNYLYKKDE